MQRPKSAAALRAQAPVSVIQQASGSALNAVRQRPSTAKPLRDTADPLRGYSRRNLYAAQAKRLLSKEQDIDRRVEIDHQLEMLASAIDPTCNLSQSTKRAIEMAVHVASEKRHVEELLSKSHLNYSRKSSVVSKSAVKKNVLPLMEMGDRMAEGIQASLHGASSFMYYKSETRADEWMEHMLIGRQTKQIAEQKCTEQVKEALVCWEEQKEKRESNLLKRMQEKQKNRLSQESLMKDLKPETEDLDENIIVIPTIRNHKKDEQTVCILETTTEFKTKLIKSKKDRSMKKKTVKKQVVRKMGQVYHKGFEVHNQERADRTPIVQSDRKVVSSLYIEQMNECDSIANAFKKRNIAISKLALVKALVAPLDRTEEECIKKLPLPGSNLKVNPLLAEKLANGTKKKKKKKKSTKKKALSKKSKK